MLLFHSTGSNLTFCPGLHFRFQVLFQFTWRLNFVHFWHFLPTAFEAVTFTEAVHYATETLWPSFVRCLAFSGWGGLRSKARRFREELSFVLKLWWEFSTFSLESGTHGSKSKSNKKTEVLSTPLLWIWWRLPQFDGSNLTKETSDRKKRGKNAASHSHAANPRGEVELLCQTMTT